jgi:acetyl-CoA C-acetyltransferase
MQAVVKDPVVIVSVARTPIGGMLGELSGFSAAELGGFAIQAAIERAGIKADQVQELIFGNCLMAGQGQAPARQASFKGGLPSSTGCTTITKMCGSGMKSAMMAHDLLLAGSADVMVAGGMESMSQAPYLLLKGRTGYRYGHSTVYDHMAMDGLEDAYDKGRPMGSFAEECVAKYQFTREAQDAFAIESLRRAKLANEDGSFQWEIAPVKMAYKTGDVFITKDEQPFKSKIDKIPALKPVFKKDGTITAANASSISDGAAAMVLMRLSEAEKRGLKPIAKVVAHATHAHEPAWFTTAPVLAITQLLQKSGWTTSDVDLFEINEAFAAVTMAAMREHQLPHEKVNIHGGACALGHPIGASGARIIATLLGALRKTGGKKGIASLCIGGGEAVAMSFEMF